MQRRNKCKAKLTIDYVMKFQNPVGVVFGPIFHTYNAGDNY